MARTLHVCPNCGHELAKPEAAKRPARAKSKKIPKYGNYGAKPYTPEQWAAVTYAANHGVNPDWRESAEPSQGEAAKQFAGYVDATIAARAEEAAAIRAEEIERLSRCACGHRSDQHYSDELENLLRCLAAECDCDHFHYIVVEQAA